MPSPRLLLPHSLFTLQWPLCSILRLPVELRPLALQSFSSLTARHAQHVDDFTPFTVSELPQTLDSAPGFAPPAADIATEKPWERRMRLKEERGAQREPRRGKGSVEATAPGGERVGSEEAPSLPVPGAITLHLQDKKEEHTGLESPRLEITESRTLKLPEFPLSEADKRVLRELADVEARLVAAKVSSNPNLRERLELEILHKELHLKKNQKQYAWAEEQSKRVDVTAEQRTLLYKILKAKRKATGRLPKLREVLNSDGDFGAYLNHVGVKETAQERVAKVFRSRLGHLKRSLLDNPAAADTPAIQEQLFVLEKAFRASLSQDLPKTSIVDGASNTGVGAVNVGRVRKVYTAMDLAAEKAAMKDRIASSSTIPGYRKLELAPKESTAISDYQEAISPAKAAELNVGQTSQLENLPTFAELRNQIKALTDLVRTLLLQHPLVNEGLPATAAAEIPRTTRYLADDGSIGSDKVEQLTGKEDNSFFTALPHELDVKEDFTSKPTPVPETPPTKIAHSLPVSAREAGQFSTDAASGTSMQEIESLYDSLFPEEVKPISQDTTKTSKPVARLPLPKNLPKNAQQLNKQHAPQVPKSKHAINQFTVLTLRNASKSLTEDDFRRAIPRGKHMKEWARKGAFTRVIPVRDPWTMEQTGDYHIVFSSPTDAEAFAAHVKRVFELTKLHTPTSLLSPLPPGPSYLKGKNDEEADAQELVQNFSLIPPSQTSVLTLEKEKWNAKVLEERYALWSRGAYPQALVGGEAKSGHQVLIGMVGSMMPNWYQLRDAINRDGIRRNLLWELLPGDLGIRKVEMQKPTKRSLDGEGGEGWGGMREGFETEERLSRPRHGQKWILAFVQKEEASRFARKWNRRKFPWGQGERPKDYKFKGATMVRCEVLW